ncbi:uncharacterized protein PRCAT00001820001 [Priceomyces carsonii]|uniref:uncharacterized protein n=1 Tax=Priceomyces carsonii TaxID=28549 RepID=UPI002ED7CBB9|nr:unnamed protein product [Priceomyces carsonii]
MTETIADMGLPHKDDEELELEKLVFGDIEGFQTNLKKLDNLFEYSSDDEDDTGDNFYDVNSDIEENDNEGALLNNEMFFIDESGVDKVNEDDNMEVDRKEGSSDEDGDDSESDAVWEDSDDERIQISLMGSSKVKKLRSYEEETSINGKSFLRRLRSQFEKIYPKPEWVEKLEMDPEIHLSDEYYDGDENDENRHRPGENDSNAVLRILSSTQKFIINKQLKLISPNKISISRLKDVSHQNNSKAAIQSMSFHRSHPLLITGGFDRTVRVFHIDGKVNSMVTSLHFRNSPISTCQFSSIGTEDNQNVIFAAGRRRYMNKWDLNSGQVEKISRLYGHEKFQKSFEYFKISPKGTFIGLTGSSGWCNILSGLTGQWVNGFKIEGTIVDFEFSKDESFLIVINSAGDVWEYNLASTFNSKNMQSKIIRRWQDDGSVGVTKMKLGGQRDRWLAIGTNNGFVNLYDRNTFSNGNPKPFKVIENLTTSVSNLSFSPDGQILCISSRAKRDALRLVHLPTGSVYANWPTSGTPLGRVTAVDFSPNNEILAIGNEAGKVTLWRLNHF